jgi:hypothetical protein
MAANEHTRKGRDPILAKRQSGIERDPDRADRQSWQEVDSI